MSIATELTRIANAKAAIKTAINAKGGTLTNELIGSYASAINSLNIGSMDFYKCATVGSGTWTGFKAVLSSGRYSYESTLTSSGLTFDSTKTTPVVGRTYSADALIQAYLYTGWSPPSGAIFYEPFTDDVSAAQTGQAYTKTGTVTFARDTSTGFDCNVATFDGNSKWSFPFSDMPTGANPWSLSVWLYNTNSSSGSSDANPIFEYGDGGSSNFNHMLWFGVGSSSVAAPGTHGSGAWSYEPDCPITLSDWTHYAFTYDGSYVKAYKDGTLIGSGSEQHTLNTYSASSNATIGAFVNWDTSPQAFYTGKMSSFRIYARALTQAEVTTLYLEHGYVVNG